MNCERWSQIRDLFDATVSLPPSERGLASQRLWRRRESPRRRPAFARS